MRKFAFSKIKYMDYVEIQGYKSIKKQKIDLKNINILIGANGSGKSNFLSFFEFIHNICNQNLKGYTEKVAGGVDKILYNGSEVTNMLCFKLEFDNGVNGYSVILENGVDGLVFNHEGLIYKGDERNISGFGKEANLKTVDEYRAKCIIRYMNGFRKYHFKTSAFTKMSNIKNDIYYLYKNGDNLAAFLYNIKQKNAKVYNRIISVIQSIAPYFSDFFLQPNEEGLLYLQWKDKYCDTVYGVNDLSDGTIRFIALAILFLQPVLPDTIIIDEPELGLHPTAIAKLSGMIKSASSRECQVILSTQSTELISYFKPEDIITVDKINGESKFERLKSTELSVWLEDYSLGDLWKSSVIALGQLNY